MLIINGQRQDSYNLLAVQPLANSTAVLTVKNAAGTATVLSVDTTNQRLKVGTAFAVNTHTVAPGSAPNAWSGIFFVPEYDDPDASAYGAYIVTKPKLTAHNGNLIVGVLGAVDPIANAGFNYTDQLVAFKGDIHPAAGAYTIDEAYGLRTHVRPENGVTVTTYAGYYVEDIQVVAGGAVTNNYGIYIEAIDSGVTINRAIYVAGGVSEFNGAILMGNNVAIQGKKAADGAAQSMLYIGTNDSVYLKSPLGTLYLQNNVAGNIWMWGNGTGTGQYLYLLASPATVGDTLKDSPELTLSAYHWNGSSTIRHAAIYHKAVTAGAAPETQLVMKVAASTILVLDDTNGAAKVGFFNTTPAIQQTKTGHNNWAAIADVTAALAAYGLVDAA